jgi:hypothetical protein
MPHTRVPLSINIHKLMAPQQGIGGILELPIRVAGLPITAAATGGRMIYQNLAGALGVGSARKGSGKENDRYNDVLDETGWLGPSEEYWEERGLYGRDAAARGEVDAGDQGSSSSSVGVSDAAADGTAVLVPRSDPAVAAALNAAGPSSSNSSSSSRASPFGQGQALKVTMPAGSSSSVSSRPMHARRLSDDAATPRASGMSRLDSRSAPLSGYPDSASHPADRGVSSSSRRQGQAGQTTGQTSGQTEGQAIAADAAAPPDMPEVRGPSLGPGKPAVGTQQQEEQQQKEKEEKQKEELQSMQGTATGKDAKNLGGTQIKPVRRWGQLGTASVVCIAAIKKLPITLEWSSKQVIFHAYSLATASVVCR